MRPLTPDLLLRAYAMGLFPMARSRDDAKLYWIDPEERGIIPLGQFHIPKSLRKVMKQGKFEIRIDTAFAQVMAGCAETKTGRDDTWINDQIVELFCDLHALGLAHSVESWRDGRLVGGLYGLALGSAFFGESMFSRETDASKAALVDLVARMRLAGATLLDTQFITDHLARFGAREIPKREYMAMLTRALDRVVEFPTGNVDWRLALSAGTGIA